MCIKEKRVSVPLGQLKAVFTEVMLKLIIMQLHTAIQLQYSTAYPFNATSLAPRESDVGHVKLGSVNQRNMMCLDVCVYQSQAHIYKPINV